MTSEMPLLLDGAMHVDAAMNVMGGAMALDDVDLFGDAVMETTLELPVRPPLSKQLLQRLDDLRGRGCCQSIAWSRQGSIASISKDGRSLELRFLRSHPENGSWDLSEPNLWPGFSSALGGSSLTHLAWASTSSPELAVIDSVGRVAILGFGININRPYYTRRWDADAVDDLHAVVGCYWLPLIPSTRQFNALYGPATWTHTEYKYESSAVPAFGPWHPNPAKSALFCVTTNGLLKVFFSQNNNKIEERTLELESVTSSDDLITHASICSDKHALCLVLATTSNQLKVVRANIQWGLPQGDNKVPPGSMPLDPSLKEKHIATTSWLQYGPSNSQLDNTMAQLSLVKIFPQAMGTGGVWTPAVVITARTYTPTDPSHYNQDVQTIIDRWEIVEQKEQKTALHSAFQQLGSKNGQGTGATQAPSTRLRKLDPIIIPKVIISIHTMQLDKVMCFAFSDGTVQFRDRFTMDEIWNEVDTSRIMSPLQAGFHYVNETPCLQVAFSPTNCSFVQICEDGSVKWNSLHYPMDDLDTPMAGHDPYPAIRAALSVPASSAALSHVNFDDILAIARPFTKKNEFAYDWIREVMTMLKIPVDYSEESHHDQLMRNNYLHVCLSILNHLGFRGEFNARTFGGKFSLLALNLRNIVVLITIASNTPINLKERLSPLDEPEVVDALAGCTKWALDLLAWLSDALFQRINDPKFMSILSEPKHFSELSNYLKSQNDVSLHFVLCSSTRGYLSAACRRLLHLDSLSQRAIQWYNQKGQASAADGTSKLTPSLCHAYRKVQRYTSSSLVSVQEFDKLINQLGVDIRAAYQGSLPALVNKSGNSNNPQNNTSNGRNNSNGGANGNQQPGGAANDPMVKKAQSQIELDMLLAANPPPAFREVLSKFFAGPLRDFRSTTDPAELYFADYRLLEVDDDPKSLHSKRHDGYRVDVFKRVPVVSRPENADARAAAGLSGSHAAFLLAAGQGDLAGPSGRHSAGPDMDGAGGGAGDGGSSGPQYRRCGRCAAIMEDMIGQRPGFTFVLGQQRKCPCGGSWGLLPKGSWVV